MTPPLSVAIVSWNVGDLLAECLESLAADGVPQWAEVRVVDNASTDGSCAMIRERFPWVRLERSERNLGFARANNRAIRRCRSEFILLLNPDTVVFPGSLRSLLDYAQSHPRCGAVGPKQYSGTGQVQAEAAVALPTIWNILCDWLLLSRCFPRNRWLAGRKLGFWDHEDNRPVPAIAGSAMLLRREALAQVGLLDERMFMLEDMDLCYRLRQAGWEVYYLGSAAIRHYGGASLRRAADPGGQLQIAYHSFWIYLRKHRGRLHAACLTAAMGVWSLAALALLRCASGAMRLRLLRQRDLETWRTLARAVGRWARADKRHFRHPLVAGWEPERQAPWRD